MYYTHCVDHTPLCIFRSHHMMCRLHTVYKITHWCVALHTLCGITQSMSNYYTVQCQLFCVQYGKIYTAQKNLHRRRPWQISGMMVAFEGQETMQMYWDGWKESKHKKTCQCTIEEVKKTNTGGIWRPRNYSQWKVSPGKKVTGNKQYLEIGKTNSGKKKEMDLS